MSDEIDPVWGARGWLCGRCRSALPQGGACCRYPRAFELADPTGRAEVAKRVWHFEPRSVWFALRKRRYRRALERLVGKLRTRFGAPNGVKARATRRPLRPGLTGVARGTGAVPPCGGAPCLAYGLELRSHRFEYGPIMLRDHGAAGLTVELDDGRRVRIPAGPIQVAMEDAPVEAVAAPDWRRLLAWTGAAPAPEGRPLVPHDEVIVRRIRDGDRVELWADLVADDGPTAYRDTVGLRACGAICLAPARDRR